MDVTISNYSDLTGIARKAALHAAIDAGGYTPAIAEQLRGYLAGEPENCVILTSDLPAIAATLRVHAANAEDLADILVATGHKLGTLYATHGPAVLKMGGSEPYHTEWHLAAHTAEVAIERANEEDHFGDGFAQVVADATRDIALTLLCAVQHRHEG